MKLHRTAFLVAGIWLAGVSQANAADHAFRILADSEYASPAINNSGQIVANSTVWSGNSRTELLTLGGTLSTLRVVDINAAGTVAGSSELDSGWSGTTHAAVWKGSAPTDLGTLGGRSSYAQGINDAGHVVGASDTSTGTRRAFIWNGTRMSELRALTDGGNSNAMNINNNGQVVGASYDNVARAVTWNGNSITALSIPDSTLYPLNSVAWNINNSGVIVGAVETEENYEGRTGMRATVWNGATRTDLGTLAGYSSEALGVNASGLIAGWSSTTTDWYDMQQAAVVWRNGAAIDLNTLLDAAALSNGWHLRVAYGINDSGMVVGDAYNNITGKSSTFSLSVSPVPEADTYAMLLAGLGLLGLIARRRKASV